LEVRNAFIAVSRNEQLQQVLDRWYAEDLPGCHPPARPEDDGEATSCGD
jgi:hypothetical protein